MFKKVLIANRGQIQANCIRAVRELGGKAVAAYEGSVFDSNGIRNAHEVVEIRSTKEGENPFRDVGAIVTAAKACGADAVHPGYGFLAQSAELSNALKSCGIAFIGPVLEGEFSLANKPQTKLQAKKAGIQVLPGSSVLYTWEELQKAAGELKFPLVVKALDGFGGRGIRIAYTAAELQDAYEHVINHASKNGYTQNAVFLEHYLAQAHHVEFPVLRDAAGRVLVLPEQECSVQRRFQKLMVETPSPTLTESLRTRMRSQVAALVSRLNVVGYASVEFLVRGGDAWFLEINGYIQPSHSATTMLCGIDVLREQIRLAARGDLQTSGIDLNGHGNVVGVYVSAIDPERKFAPSPGRIDRFYLPFGEGLQVQTTVGSGDVVSGLYDPLIAKVLVHDVSRDSAIARMVVALDEFYIDGIRTTLGFMRAIVQSVAFRRGKIDTSYLFSEDRRVEMLESLRSEEQDEVACLLAALALHKDSNQSQILDGAQKGSLVWSMASRILNRKKMEF